MSGHTVLPEDLPKREWFRLTALYDNVSVRFITDLNRFVAQRQSDGFLEKATDRVIVQIGSTSARAYSIPFRAKDFIELSNDAADRIGALLSPSSAKKAVTQMLPKGTDFLTATQRADMPGLDAAAAVRVEKYRQEHPDDKHGAESLIRQERTRRINLIARTEVVRIGSDVLDRLWLLNMEIGKAADRPLMQSDLAISGGVIPRYARKVWVTRKDSRVCRYCEPLDGITTGVGQYFTTIYGRFSGPPVHPGCRCVPALTARGKRP